MRTSLVVCLLSVTTLIGGLSASAEEPSADHVVLASGERVEGDIVEAGPEVVRMRIGERTYAFDRVSLKAVHRAGATELDPEMLSFVRDLAPRLVHADERLRRAAAAGLRALGEEAQPYLDAVAVETINDRAREALRALDLTAARRTGARADRAGWVARFVEGQVKWAKENVELTAKQEPGLRKALETFFKGLGAASDRQKAVDAFFGSLGSVLNKDQIKGMREAWQKFGNR